MNKTEQRIQRQAQLEAEQHLNVRRAREQFRADFLDTHDPSFMQGVLDVGPDATTQEVEDAIDWWVNVGMDQHI